MEPQHDIPVELGLDESTLKALAKLISNMTCGLRALGYSDQNIEHFLADAVKYSLRRGGQQDA